MLQYRESKYPKVSQAGIGVKTGRKWRTQEAMEQGKSWLHHKDLVGTVATCRAGLGSI